MRYLKEVNQEPRAKNAKSRKKQPPDCEAFSHPINNDKPRHAQNNRSPHLGMHDAKQPFQALTTIKEEGDTMTISNLTSTTSNWDLYINQKGTGVSVEDVDTDGDGVVSEEELAAAIEDEDLASSVFEELDTDEDGVVSEEELEDAQSELQENRNNLKNMLATLLSNQGTDESTTQSLVNYINGDSSDLTEDELTAWEEFVEKLQQNSVYTNSSTTGLLVNISA